MLCPVVLMQIKQVRRQKQCCCCFGEMWLLCVAAHHAAGVQAVEAQALYQTANPEAQSISLATEAQHGSTLSKTSAWTGLVDLDNSGVDSIARTDNSSEISEEHVVIHLRPGEGWDGPSREDEVQSDGPKSGNTSVPSNLRSLESHGGSAQEEEDAGYFGSSDIPTLSTIATSTPQPQTSNSALAEFVKSLMRPFTYWTGGVEVVGKHKGPSGLEEKAGGNHALGEASTRNMSFPKPSGNKGSVDNAIVEPRGGGFSSWTPTTGVQSPGEGLSEQEKEVMPLIRLVPAVQATGQSDNKTRPGEQASNPPSTINGMSSCLCVIKVHP